MTMVDQPGESRDLFGRRLPSRPAGVARQLALPLAWSSGLRDQALFQVSASNRDAVLHLQRAAQWHAPASILVGPAGSGRSTLGQMFVEAGAGELVDGLRNANEDALFHAWNRAHAQGHRLLIIADDVSDVAGVRLPDLATRLATAPIVSIGEPDDCLIRDLVEHLLIRRGLMPASQLGSYVAARLDRSYAAIHAVVDAIDAAALAAGRQPGIRIARSAMIDAGLQTRTDDERELPESI